ncbi:hypothetical protein [Psychroserpens algicola]|uniref:DUF1871 family protein n=1 Tax=Psychroserpens algicola TaxID=1719034 RepID=A0ABT0HD80_9FLAO|nr:hypothetical protein [Psychroserpens algicola]MCK8482318.1 hypothetical protein [Psychroserpens algicola]
MNHRDKYYIELAEIVHQTVVNWDPLALISSGAPKDEYDSIEKRFLSGLINLEPDENIKNKVKKNLEYFGVDFEEIGSYKEIELDSEILKILAELKKHIANDE